MYQKESLLRFARDVGLAKLSALLSNLCPQGERAVGGTTQVQHQEEKSSSTEVEWKSPAFYLLHLFNKITHVVNINRMLIRTRMGSKNALDLQF